MPKNDNNEKSKIAAVQKWRDSTAGWRPYIEKPLPLEDLDELMVSGSIPAFGFYFMLLLSSVIATLGLLANSAPAIIGAMIIAPLMAPIISFAYSIDIFDWRLARRSLITVITGVLLVIFVAFLCTSLIGLRFAGTEILSRTSPTLLDMGIATAAGAAAAFSYTRQSIATSIAGVAISVALVPPLAVTGIGIAYGQAAFTDVGLSLTELGHYSGGVDIALGSFILFATNLLGIIFFACLVFLSQGYGQWRKAGLGIVIVLACSISIIDPLQRSLYKLIVKNEAISLMVTLPEKYPHVFTNDGRVDSIHVNYHGEILHLNIEGVFPSLNLTDEETLQRMKQAVDIFQGELQKEIGSEVIVELNAIPVDMLNYESGADHMDPKKFISPQERQESSIETKILDDMTK
jgi:uncharacterized hydrophobic protein (TIGR00271 family)